MYVALLLHTLLRPRLHPGQAGANWLTPRAPLGAKTSMCAAPEVVRGDKVGREADVWQGGTVSTKPHRYNRMASPMACVVTKARTRRFRNETVGPSPRQNRKKLCARGPFFPGERRGIEFCDREIRRGGQPRH